MSDAERSVPASPSSPSSRSAHCLLSDDVIVQVLQWLPVPCAVHSGRTSKAFSRAALASLRRGTWATTRDDDCRGRHGSSSTEETAASSEEEEEEGALLSQGGRLGTPCLDLRSAGDAVDCAALLGLLGRGFKAGSTTPPMRQEERQRQSSTGGRSKASVEGVDVISSSGACSKSGIVFTPSERKQERPVLRGLAVRSSALEDEVRTTQQYYRYCLFNTGVLLYLLTDLSVVTGVAVVYALLAKPFMVLLNNSAFDVALLIVGVLVVDATLAKKRVPTVVVR